MRASFLSCVPFVVDQSVLSWYCRSQIRQPIQTLEDARDAVQTIYVGKTYIVTGSVDGHVRTYDLRMGELRTDFFGRMCVSLEPCGPTLTIEISLHSHTRTCNIDRTVSGQPDLPRDNT